jgi:6-pyruvoyltetrahydropterin/6-carboxytetrahydropterin synthase
MSIVTVSKRIEIDYGHTLPNHFSFCNQFHGHRGFIEAHVIGEVSKIVGCSSQGMVIDFKILKKLMMEKIHDVLDHGFAIWNMPSKDLDFIRERNNRYITTSEPPTAEYLAKWAFFQIAPELPSNITLEKIVWYETPSSAASYTQKQAELETNHPITGK